jgi:hypothetical protein
VGVAFGLSIVGGWKLPHWWYGLLILGLFYAMLFGEGAYRVYNEAAATSPNRTAAVSGLPVQLLAASKVERSDPAIDAWVEDTRRVIQLPCPEHEAEFVTDTYQPESTPAVFSGSNLFEGMVEDHRRIQRRLDRHVQRLRGIIREL